MSTTVTWIALVAANLNDYLLGEQIEALRTEALAPGQADPFTEVSVDVINKVRFYIASNPKNQVSAAPLLIPPELKQDVAYLVIAPLLGRLGIALTKDQTEAVDRAYSTLVGLRDGKLLVSNPDDAVLPAVQGSTGVEIVSQPCREFTRDSFRF